MAFNPQKPSSVFSEEEQNIIDKCLYIAIKNKGKYNRYKLVSNLNSLTILIISFDHWIKAAGGEDILGKEEFDEYCIKYGISKEYERYIIKNEFNYYVECYEIAKENNIFGLKHPAEKIKEIAKEDYLIENPRFRGKPITINTKVIGNKEYTFVSYDDKEYKFDEFLIAMYPGKRINKSVVYFPDTIANLLKIGPTQRIKMKYDILTNYFGLPYINDNEKDDLSRFLNKYYDNTTIQKYCRRFNWDSGIEKMVAFGADLDISGKADGAIEGFYFYEYTLNKGKAIITGIDIELKYWLLNIKTYIMSVFNCFCSHGIILNEKQIELFKNRSLMRLYYQQERRVAIPESQIGRPIKEVINNCIDTVYKKTKIDISINSYDIIDGYFNTLSILDCKSEDYRFTVDFEKDIIIVDTKSAARAQQVIEQVYMTAAERLIGFKAGDKITTKELRERGYKNNNGKAINTLVEYGILQKGVLRGSYIMLKDF